MGLARTGGYLHKIHSAESTDSDTCIVNRCVLLSLFLRNTHTYAQGLSGVIGIVDTQTCLLSLQEIDFAAQIWVGFDPSC